MSSDKDNDSMKQVGLFVDVSNIYHGLGKKYNRKLSYKKLMEYANSLGEVSVAKAYGTMVTNKANTFIHCLEQSGFKAIYKKIPKNKRVSWDMRIFVDALMALEDLDIIIIGSGAYTIAPAVQFLASSGVHVIVIGAGISRDMLSIPEVKVVEIPESMLEDQNC